MTTLKLPEAGRVPLLHRFGLRRSHHTHLRSLLLGLLLGVAPLLFQSLADAQSNGSALRSKAKALVSAGNYNDAYSIYRTLLLESPDEGAASADDLLAAVRCLQSLSRVAESDALLESAIKAHGANWQLLSAAAKSYRTLPHQGYVVAGEFNRGWARGGMSKVLTAEARDRVRALQLLLAASAAAEKHASPKDRAELALDFASALIGTSAWKLQAQTDLQKLPEYEEGYSYSSYGGPQLPAPVDEEGKPVYYHVPPSLEGAANDGERWRWALNRAAELDPDRRDEIAFSFATFLEQQFGTRTLLGQPFALADDDEQSNDSSHLFSLQTLKEDETLARLASGVQRFALPREFCFIAILRELAEKKGRVQERAIDDLARVYEDRRQYPLAAETWRRAIELFGAGSNGARQKRLDQIVGAWGEFEPILNQPAGQPGTFEYRFRNGTSVSFEARTVDVDLLLKDVMEYLRSNPKNVDWSQIEINNIGYRIVTGNQSKYIGKQVAHWDLPLTPREQHFTKRITVTSPLKEAGAYLVTATMPGGNTSRCVLWLNDTAIVKKPLKGSTLYFLADAARGIPAPKMELQFFGYRQEYVNSTVFSGRYSNVKTTSFTAQTDRDGQYQAERSSDDQFTWLVIARGAEGRFAYLGFSGMWFNSYYDSEYNQTKLYGITDRPVYRPAQTVHYKVWARHAQYDREEEHQYAHASQKLVLTNARGDKLDERTVQLDEWGGFEGSYALPKDAQLGVYSLAFEALGSAFTFRVEEYKKPEFEVAVEAPGEPVALGETVRAKLTAKYYFGSPVTKARVKLKVTRSDYDARWYPVGIWDWFYGVGYWWFAYDAIWFPGWSEWGCRAPFPWWIWHGQSNPPELVQERELEIGSDGSVPIEIDTAVAKALHGNTDHKYEITAEVVDESRRVITGTGTVLVARKPFKVYAWLDRGYYRAGQTIHADFSAQTLNNKPVAGAGVVKLFSVTYDQDRTPHEEEVQRWSLDTNSEGKASLLLTAARLGQYRLAYTLDDKHGHTREGGYLFTVVGEGFTGSDFRFNAVELIPDKREYSPGEKIQLQINTDLADATVLLFTRPASGVYLPPEIIRLNGKSTIREITVEKRDMPNFFLEAVTVQNGQVYSQAKEIIVPPEKRVLNVELLPSAKTFKPGETATVAVKVTDFDGRPFAGTAVASVYDKSVEYISGGSNVPEIKEFFWKWRRSHQPTEETNLERLSSPVHTVNEIPMSLIGAFGGADVEEPLQRIAPQGGREPVAKSRRREQQGSEMALNTLAEGFAAPAAAPMELADGVDLRQAKDKGGAATKSDAAGAESGSNGAEPMAQPTIRKEFADTAYWNGTLALGNDGLANLTFRMPENLTDWKLRFWALGAGSRVGEATVEMVTTKNLLLRLQAPRFFVEKDEVVLSANVHNALASAKRVRVKLELPGSTLKLAVPETQEVEIPAGGEQRVDWRVLVAHEGEATVRMLALTDEESDATEMKFPVYVHGMLKTESFSGAIRPENSDASVVIRVPAERRPEQTRLEVRYSPTLAGAMVDALPYLGNFPYGCTEQTLNRFLPTVITQKVLQDMKLNLKEIREKRTNLNAQEIGNDQERATRWKQYDIDPVFDEAKVHEMARSGLERLAAMQLGDGGWGWFSGYGETASPHLSATVMHGLHRAREAGLAVPDDVWSRGLSYLRSYQAGELQKLKNANTKTEPYKVAADELDALVELVLLESGLGSEEMRELLYRDRTKMAVYAKAIQGLIFEHRGDAAKVQMLRQNIEQYLVQDDENQTAYLNLGNEGFWWYWYGSEYEAQAYYLKLLTKVDPHGSTAPKLVKYLLNNRKHATYWNSTRDTAIVIEAFADYLRASGESDPDVTLTVLLDGQSQKEVHITRENLFTYDNALLISGAALTSGEHTLALKKRGKGAIYFNAYLTNFTLEDPIAKAGLEIKVERKYYKLVRDEAAEALARGGRGQAVKQRIERYKREPLADNALLNSGDMVEVELEVESKNDYEYIVFEDYKPAGFEPVEVRSGYTKNDLGAYVEFRDERVAFFARTLPRGKRSVAYRVRAEVPGAFHALPARGSAMYAPELKANSDESRVRVKDAK